MNTPDQTTQRALEQRYLTDYVMTATPERRLLMLFDQLRIDLHGSLDGIEAKDLKQANDHLVHAQQILCALRDPLDRSVAIGKTLYSLYSFCLDTLIAANLKKDPGRVADVLAIIERIADANAAALSAGGSVHVAA
jgi:flagellar protein FliS